MSQSALTLPDIIHTPMTGSSVQGASGPSITNIHATVTQFPYGSNLNCLSQGHIKLWTIGAGDQTANPLIEGRPGPAPWRESAVDNK